MSPPEPPGGAATGELVGAPWGMGGAEARASPMRSDRTPVRSGWGVALALAEGL